MYINFSERTGFILFSVSTEIFTKRLALGYSICKEVTFFNKKSIIYNFYDEFKENYKGFNHNPHSTFAIPIRYQSISTFPVIREVIEGICAKCDLLADEDGLTNWFFGPSSRSNPLFLAFYHIHKVFGVSDETTRNRISKLNFIIHGSELERSFIIKQDKYNKKNRKFYQSLANNTEICEFCLSFIPEFNGCLVMKPVKEEKHLQLVPIKHYHAMFDSYVLNKF